MTMAERVYLRFVAERVEGQSCSSQRRLLDGLSGIEGWPHNVRYCTKTGYSLYLYRDNSHILYHPITLDAQVGNIFVALNT